MPGYANKSATDIGGILNTTTVRNVGESEQLLYTATKKSAVMSVRVANRTGGILPISLYAKRTVTASINLKSLTSNVATISTTAAHGLFTGDSVTISGVDATFNGTYTITAVPSTVSFKYAKTAANVASTAVSPVGTVSASDAIFYLVKDLRVNNGESAQIIEEPFSLVATDRLYAISGVENAFDVVLSIQEGVN
jgi:hypothetical protein